MENSPKQLTPKGEVPAWNQSPLNAVSMNKPSKSEVSQGERSGNTRGPGTGEGRQQVRQRQEWPRPKGSAFRGRSGIEARGQEVTLPGPHHGSWPRGAQAADPRDTKIRFWLIVSNWKETGTGAQFHRERIPVPSCDMFPNWADFTFTYLHISAKKIHKWQ